MGLGEEEAADLSEAQTAGISVWRSWADMSQELDVRQ